MKIISSKDNSLIKKIRSLSVKKYREQFALFVVEGEKVVFEALNINGLVEYLIIDSDYQEHYKSVINKYYDKVLVTTKPVFESLTSTVNPQRIMAVVKASPEEPLVKGKNVLVLDHLQDPGNLGTIIRSSVASGFDNIIMIDCVDPYNDKTIRSASGTIFYPKIIKTTIEGFINIVKEYGLNILVAEAGENNIFDSTLNLPKPYALVIGNEGNGVSKELLSLKHTSISIPMDKRVESLNAAVSASVLMFILRNKF